MNTPEGIKEIVREKYSEIALQSTTENANSCCGVGGCATVDYAVFAEDYSKLAGYHAEADLGLGCGLPTEFAQIKPGDTVLDLGAGAGNDCFVARAIVGETGKVIGVDMTNIMVQKARENADKLGFNNVEFRLGEIEHLPVAANRIDVVISNCVLNLVPNKAQALAETFRVLKPGGHFSISDVVLEGQLPDGLRNDAEMYAGCVSGALQLQDYLQLITETGFQNISVQKKRAIQLPNEILDQYLTAEEKEAFVNHSTGIFSVTVYAEKPDQACCAPGCCA